MDNRTYIDKLKDPRWQRKRLEIFNRDNWTCQLCLDTETELQIHHLVYTGEPYEAPSENLQTLCKHCHFLVKHLKDILDKNEIPIIKKYYGKLVLTSNKYTFIFSYEKDIDIDIYLVFPRNSEVLEYLYKINKL